jgi:hypothetical protein
MSFIDLGLVPDLLRALSEKGYSAPTPDPGIMSAAVFTEISGLSCG